MKITFKNSSKEVKGEVLFVSIGSKNKDEIVKEGGVKTLDLKCEETEKMNLRKLYLLIRKMVQMAKGAKASKISFDFNYFKFK